MAHNFPLGFKIRAYSLIAPAYKLVILDTLICLSHGKLEMAQSKKLSGQ